MCHSHYRDEEDFEYGTKPFITALDGLSMNVENAIRISMLDVPMEKMHVVMRVGMDSFREPGVATAKSGRKLLFTIEVFWQELHTYFEVIKRNDSKMASCYFVICMPASGVSLFVSQCFHRILQNLSEIISYISRGIKVVKKWIAPYSLVFGRGDLIHA